MQIISLIFKTIQVKESIEEKEIQFKYWSKWKKNKWGKASFFRMEYQGGKALDKHQEHRELGLQEI